MSGFVTIVTQSLLLELGGILINGGENIAEILGGYLDILGVLERLPFTVTKQLAVLLDCSFTDIFIS
jgi:hypothetical protein